MARGGQQKCAKCGEIGHLAQTCTSTKELRNMCICDTVEGLTHCGNHISETDWNKGYRIHGLCKNFLAGAASLLALIGTCIPGRRATIKAPRKVYSGTGECTAANDPYR